MECIVHFEVVHRETDHVAKIRGLVITSNHEQPTVDDLQNMLRSMGYDVHCADEATLRFESTDTSTDVKEIHIKKVDTGQETFIPDSPLQLITEQLMDKPKGLF